MLGQFLIFCVQRLHFCTFKKLWFAEIILPTFFKFYLKTKPTQFEAWKWMKMSRKFRGSEVLLAFKALKQIQEQLHFFTLYFQMKDFPA